MKGQNTKMKYARDISGKRLHIEEVDRGLNGYYCLGCELEVIAHQGGYMDWHFKHYAKDKKKAEVKCTVYNESYRHKVAKELLLKNKTIKVPALYKFEGNSKYKVMDPQFIDAHFARPEITFFEDENGEVRSSQKAEIKDFLIKPDITFLMKKASQFFWLSLLKLTILAERNY